MKQNPAPPSALGDFELGPVIRRVGPATVYRGRDLRRGRDVTLKVLLEAGTDSEGLRRFEREMKLLGSLQHPGVGQLYSWGSTPEAHYLVLEPEDGVLLSDRLRTDGPLTALALASLALSLAQALTALHDHGLVHRDLRPSGLLFGPDDSVRLVDLGFAKLKGNPDVSAVGVVVGTPRYLSPEALSGEEATPLSDLYQMGLVLYEAACGQPAFSASVVSELAEQILVGEIPPLHSVAPDIPPNLERIIHWCLSYDPAHRPSRASVVVEALERVHRELLSEPVPDDDENRPNRPAAHHQPEPTATQGTPSVMATDNRRPLWLRRPAAAIGLATALTLGVLFNIPLSRNPPRPPSSPSVAIAELPVTPSPTPHTREGLSPATDSVPLPPIGADPEYLRYQRLFASTSAELRAMRRRTAHPLASSFPSEKRLQKLTGDLGTLLFLCKTLIGQNDLPFSVRQSMVADFLSLARYTRAVSQCWAPILNQIPPLVNAAEAQGAAPRDWFRARLAHFMARMHHSSELEERGRADLEACLRGWDPDPVKTPGGAAARESASILSWLEGVDRAQGRWDLLLTHARHRARIHRTAKNVEWSRGAKAEARAQEIRALYQLGRDGEARSLITQFEREFPDKRERVDFTVRVGLEEP